MLANCSSKGTVLGHDYVGGLVGRLRNDSGLTNCFSHSAVTASQVVGGLVGSAYSISDLLVVNCYSIGFIIGDQSLGGLVGYASGAVFENSFYDTNTSGRVDTGKGTPKPTNQMVYPYNTKIYSSWNVPDHIWQDDIDNSNLGYPEFGVGSFTGAPVLPTQVPAITSYIINDGSIFTFSQTVVLNNICTQSPTHYRASKYIDFADATWQTYSQAPTFDITNIGVNRIYFQVKNIIGNSAILYREVGWHGFEEATISDSMVMPVLNIVEEVLIEKPTNISEEIADTVDMPSLNIQDEIEVFVDDVQVYPI